MSKAKLVYDRRRDRARSSLRRKSAGRVRLSVFRSSQHIYVQVIDDAAGKTLASASTVEKDLRSSLKSGATTEAAAVIGKRVAERALAAGVKESKVTSLAISARRFSFTSSSSFTNAF